MTEPPTNTTTPTTTPDPTAPSTPPRPAFDHHATNTSDRAPESPHHTPHPPQTLSAPPNPWSWSTTHDDDEPDDDDERQEPGAYHGPGPHSDDCDCADCLALLPPEWFADYEQYLAEEAQHEPGRPTNPSDLDRVAADEPVPAVQLVADTSGLARIYVDDPDGADDLARAIGGIVAALPVTADHRASKENH